MTPGGEGAAPVPRDPFPERLVFHPVDASRWGDMVRLFEGRGGPKHCWCMVWRATPEERRLKDSEDRKAAMAGRVAAGVPVGLLGYLDGEPVAWCSVAPRSTYRRLTPAHDPAEDEGVWAIACFFLVRRLRGKGAVRRMLAAAVDHARSQGAIVVEAYPVAPDAPSYRFMGFVPVFEEAGFVAVGCAGKRRHVMRLKVG